LWLCSFAGISDGKWEQLSGKQLLERYGMTELGMAISNPYHGERRAGYVGLPLPGVSIKLVDENMKKWLLVNQVKLL